MTADLDEGPIIEQDVTRVSHADSTPDMVALGQDVERRVLAQAVRFHAERRVLMNGNRTVRLLSLTSGARGVKRSCGALLRCCVHRRGRGWLSRWAPLYLLYPRECQSQRRESAA